MKNEDIYFFLKELGVTDMAIAKYIAKKTKRSIRTWQVKLSNGVALMEYSRNTIAIKEFNEYGGRYLKKIYVKRLNTCKKIKENML